MRTIVLSIATAIAVCVTAPAFAQQLPSVDECHALARQRGSGESAGNRNHERFIRDCLTGKVSFTIPESVRELRGMTSDVCHDLARQRGAGESAGNRAHERFIRDCMAGKVSASDARRIRTETQDVRKKSEEECDALSRQRGSGETAGRRTHERFVLDCMAGRIS